MPDQNLFTVGLIQMHCSADPDDNLRRAEEKVRAAAKQGAQIVCLPELFRTQYFCQREDAALFDLAEPIPGPTTEALSAVARETQDSSSSSVFERRARRALSQHRGHSRRRWQHSRACIARCTSRTTRFITRSFTSRPAISASRPSIPSLDASARWFAGTSGIPKARGSPRCRAPKVLFYPTAIGWHPDEKAEFGAAQHDAWRTIQRAHAIANGVYVGGVNRVGHETGDIRGNRAQGKGLEFWGGSFLAIPFGRIIAEASHDKEEILIGEVRPEASRRHAPQLAVPARPPHRQLWRRITPAFLDRRRARRRLRATASPRPASLGYRMPAEWEPHAATWLAWPHNRSDWPGKFEPIPWVYAEIVRHLAPRRRRVHLIVAATREEQRGARACSSAADADTQSRAAFITGPPTASGRATPAQSSSRNRAGAVAITNWRFNAWAKYPDWQHDDQLPDRIGRSSSSRSSRL